MYDLEIRGAEGTAAYLFVHGPPTNRRCWDALLAHAPPDARLLLLDLPDCGAAGDEPALHLRPLEDAVVAAAGHAGDGELTIVASCFGAQLVARLLPRLGRRVRRAVMIGGYATLPEAQVEARLDLLGAVESRRLSLEELRATTIDRWLGDGHAPEHEQLAQPIFDGLTDKRAARTLRRVVATAQRCIGPWEVATTIVHGESDSAVPLACGLDLADHAARAEVITLPTASHLPQLTHAAAVAPVVFGP